MKFDRQQYWENRNNGVRGQGSVQKTQIVYTGFNRSMNRKRHVNRLMTRKGYSFGHPVGSK